MTKKAFEKIVEQVVTITNGKKARTVVFLTPRKSFDGTIVIEQRDKSYYCSDPVWEMVRMNLDDRFMDEPYVHVLEQGENTIVILGVLKPNEK